MIINDLVKDFYWIFLKKRNFSQSNEEEMIKKIFEGQNEGFYIDIGCHHPMRYSNTAYLYKVGWSGINIDADRKNLNLFKFFRRRDINLNYFISKKKKHIDYCVFNERALNGIYDKKRLEVLGTSGYKPIEVKRMETYSLDEILSLYKIENKKIDFLDIDVEGHDFEVLKSINLNLIYVKVILIEVGEKQRNIELYLRDYGYSKFFKEDRNVFFIKDKDD